ncbi:MAG: lysylphosphatidylglycerol synthase domain-containing protein [Nakamurella sp.]
MPEHSDGPDPADPTDNALRAQPADPSLEDAVEILDPEPAGVPGGRRKMLLIGVKVLGIGIALLAIFLCVKVLAGEWSSVSAAIADANIALLTAGFVLGALGVWSQAFLWWRALAVFGERRGFSETTGWFFGGELGKYLPGGIWPVVGRGELARRQGVARPIAYATTLLSLGLMCVGGAFVAGVLTLFFAFGGGRFGLEMLVLLLIPIGVIGVHPAVFGRFLALARKVTKGKLDLQPPSWGTMLGLIVAALPVWIFLGAQAVVLTAALGLDQQPSRVAFAAIIAFVIGLLAIPVPAGAGVREVLFVVISGLVVGGVEGPAYAVAALCRVFLIVVDGVAGAVALTRQRTREPSADVT